MTAPYSTDPYRQGSVLSRSFLPLALITLGVFFLLGNLIPQRGRGGLIVLGLGAAFALGRVMTGRYGYAVPAGILMAIGAFISLQDRQVTPPLQSGGWLFVLLGLGFGLVYLVGLRPSRVWPLFPAVILGGLGLVLLGVGSLSALASLSWIVSFWPAALVVIGLWLLLRDQLPAAARRPLATLGGLALLAYGLLAAVASVATGGTLARTGLAPSFGSSPFAETSTVDAPIAPGQTFTVNNSSGRTTIRAGSETSVHVVATRHYSLGGQAPDVQLTPTSSGVTLGAPGSRGGFPFGSSNSVDYTIEVPAAVAVTAHSSNGRLEIDGIAGPVQADTTSGSLSLSNLGGSVVAHSNSGSTDLSNIAGEVRATTDSGRIHGTELRHLREATSNSGSIELDGTFTEQAQVRASSGSVNLKLMSGSAVQLDVSTGSGSVNPRGGLSLSGGTTQRNRLTGNLGSPVPGAVLSIETGSGSVVIGQ